MRLAIAICAVALCLVGCTTTPALPGEPFELVTGPGPADGRLGACSLGWWTAGRLVVDPRGGTGILVEGGDFATVGATLQVMWWPNFEGRRVGTEVSVFDPDGNVVATIGKRYRILAAFPFADGFVACGDGGVTPL